MVPADDSAAPVGSATVQIHAPADALWDLITDIGRTGEWSPESAGGVWLDGARGPAVGARFRGTNRRGRVTWSTTCEVVAADRGREYSFVTGSAARPETLWRYRLEPDGPGTRVTQSFELVKPLSRLARLVIRLTLGVTDRQADLPDNVRASLTNLKRVAEG